MLDVKSKLSIFLLYLFFSVEGGRKRRIASVLAMKNNAVWKYREFSKWILFAASEGSRRGFQGKFELQFQEFLFNGIFSSRVKRNWVLQLSRSFIARRSRRRVNDTSCRAWYATRWNKNPSASCVPAQWTCIRLFFFSATMLLPRPVTKRKLHLTSSSKGNLKLARVSETTWNH